MIDTGTRHAVFDPSHRYRYRLDRVWEPALPRLVVIGLNPSTADDASDDATVRRCVTFARREQLGGLVMLNVFALVATHPGRLLSPADPAARDNHAVIRGALAGRAATFWAGNRTTVAAYQLAAPVGLVVVAWGNSPFRAWALPRWATARSAVLSLLRDAVLRDPDVPVVWCFGQTRSGEPKHPLRLRSDTALVSFALPTGRL